MSSNLQYIEDIDRLRRWSRAIKHQLSDSVDYDDFGAEIERHDLPAELQSPKELMFLLLEKISEQECKYKAVQELVLSAVLEKYKYNSTKAARYLGLKRTTFYTKCVQAGLLGCKE